MVLEAYGEEVKINSRVSCMRELEDYGIKSRMNLTKI